MRLFRRMMSQHRIPTPSRLMAEMLALKIAQLPADPVKYTMPIFIEMRVKGGIVLEIRSSIDCPNKGSSSFKDLTVGYPANPHYRSVDLDWEEQRIVLKQIGLLADRSRAVRDTQREAESQDAAMSILEAIITD